MANDTLQAQFAPGASLRITDSAMLAQVFADYPGVSMSGIIFGVSPTALAAQYGVNWVNDPTTSDYQQLPAVFTLTAQSEVLGTPIDVNANGVQTLGGQDYTDPNGQHFTSVTWEWQVEVQFFTSVAAGDFSEQVVTWTGDGTSNRLIPTTIDLSAGLVAVWGCGGAIGLGTDEVNFFRHNQNMAGTMTMGITGVFANGIVGFEAGGFRVSPGVTSVKYGNTNGVPYTALVMRDTTFDRRFMRIGTYRNMSGAATSATTVTTSPNITYFSGTAWIPEMSGATINDGTNDYVFTYVDATHATIEPPYLTAGGITAFTFATDTSKDIDVSQNGGAFAAAFPVTHAWVWGSGVAYKSFEFPTDTAAELQSGGGGAAPNSLLITALNTDSFTVVDGAVWQFNIAYAYMVFNADAEFLAENFFKSFTGTSGTPPTVLSGIPFTPTLMFGRQGSASYTQGGVWRGPAQTGLQSMACANVGGNNNLPVDGIVAQGVGTFSLGDLVAHSGDAYYAWAFAGSGATDTVFGPPTWTMDIPFDPGDGSVSQIQTSQVSFASPGDGWVFQGPDPAFTDWCYPAFGLSVHQIDSPGAGWVSCSGPASDNGWYLSTDLFASASMIVSAGRPADPRSWEEIATWCTTGNMNVYGGSPAASCSINNRLVYPGRDYAPGTNQPPLRIFDGRSDKELCRVPATTADVTPQAVISLLAANGTVYFSTWDTGTTSADWRGRVIQVDPETGVQTVLGVRFAAGELPYALAWHMGRLWCGTNNAIGTIGKIYYFRPGIDTTWTLDYATTTSSAGGVTCLQSYLGKLYVGTDNASGSRGKVLVRDTAGAYTTSDTGAGGTAAINNGYLALQVLGANLYASYWNGDTTPISKIRKFDGASWTTAYTGSDDTLKPFIVLWLDNAEIYVVGGGKPYTACLLVTSDGTTWTDLTAELPESDNTMLPMVGAVVT